MHDFGLTSCFILTGTFKALKLYQIQWVASSISHEKINIKT